MPSRVVVVDMEAEGVHVTLPKEREGGVVGLVFGVGAMSLLVRGDVTSDTLPPEGHASIAFVRCTLQQSDALSCLLLSLGGSSGCGGGDKEEEGRVAARVTVGSGNTGEAGAAELRATLGKGTMEVSRQDLALLTQCSLSIAGALVQGYTDLLTLNTSLWDQHVPLAHAVKQRTNSDTHTSVKGSIQEKPVSANRHTGGHVESEPLILPRWARETCFIGHAPSLSIVLVQSRIEGGEGRGGGARGKRMCGGMTDFQVETGGGLMNGHMHVSSIGMTYDEATRGKPLCFPNLLDVSPDHTPPGLLGRTRDMHTLSTSSYGLALDWCPIEEEDAREGGAKRQRLDVTLCIGRVKGVLTKEPLEFVGQTVLDLMALVSKRLQADSNMSALFFKLLRYVHVHIRIYIHTSLYIYIYIYI